MQRFYNFICCCGIEERGGRYITIKFFSIGQWWCGGYAQYTPHYYLHFDSSQYVQMPIITGGMLGWYAQYLNGTVVQYDKDFYISTTHIRHCSPKIMTLSIACPTSGIQRNRWGFVHQQWPLPHPDNCPTYPTGRKDLHQPMNVTLERTLQVS